MFWYDGVWMSTELYIVTDRNKDRLLLSTQVAFGGKVVCAVLWQICIPAADGRPSGGNALWSRWFVDFGKSMGNDLEPFLATMSKSAIRGDVAQTDNYVPINAFYSDVIRLYLALTSLDFRKRHPIETLELVPDVMALLNILESEIAAGARLVAMGAE